MVWEPVRKRMACREEGGGGSLGSVDKMGVVWGEKRGGG